MYATFTLDTVEEGDLIKNEKIMDHLCSDVRDRLFRIHLRWSMGQYVTIIRREFFRELQ